MKEKIVPLIAMLMPLMLLMVFAPALPAQENLPAQESSAAGDLPLWLMMEQGIRAYDEGRLGDALKIFRDVAEKDSSYANVHLWIGNVFSAEGEYDAALVKYQDSLKEGRSFFPASVRTEALYSLAGVYEELGQWDEMDDTLKQIIDEASTEEMPDSRREAMLRNFEMEGPDKLLELYRLKDKAVRKAYQLRGELKLRRGDYEGAIENLMLSLTTVFSLAIDVRRLEDVEYRFVEREMNPGLTKFFTENTALLIEESMSTPELKKYFENIGLFRQLFLMGLALTGIGEGEKAEDILLLVTDHREAGVWYNFARSQISEPDLSIIPLVLQYR